MSDRIELRGLEVFARHGVFDHERTEGQLFRVDVVVRMDLSQAGDSDDVSDTLDYGVMAQRVHDVVAGERWNLIERVAARVADVVLSSDVRIDSVAVTVHKPSAPISHAFDDVAVTVERTR